MTGLLETIGGTFAAILGQPAVAVAARLALAYLVILWIAAAWWVWQDARARARETIVAYLSAAAVIIVTPLLFPLAVVAYRVLRPNRTLAEQRIADLHMAVLAAESAVPRCPECATAVEDAWIICPVCRSPLGTRCVACGRSIADDWRICAWCAAEVPWEAHADGGPGVSTTPVTIPMRPGGRPILPALSAPDPRPVSRRHPVQRQGS